MQVDSSKFGFGMNSIEQSAALQVAGTMFPTSVQPPSMDFGTSPWNQGFNAPPPSLPMQNDLWMMSAQGSRFPSPFTAPPPQMVQGMPGSDNMLGFGGPPVGFNSSGTNHNNRDNFRGQGFRGRGNGRDIGRDSRRGDMHNRDFGHRGGREDNRDRGFRGRGDRDRGWDRGRDGERERGRDFYRPRGGGGT